jgi:OHCU decarboxylase
MARRDLKWLNSLTEAEAIDELKTCCGSTHWAGQLISRRPFETFDQVVSQAHEVWWSLTSDDWLEAFRSHPKIGEKKGAAAASKQSEHWSKGEQSGMTGASEETASTLARLNIAYETKFGYIFIVCATGKSSEEMLAILRKRLENEPAEEIRIAAAEQAKITELRLRKLLGPSSVVRCP